VTYIGHALHIVQRHELVAPVVEQHDELLLCELERQRQQQQREQLEWRGLRILSCQTK